MSEQIEPRPEQTYRAPRIDRRMSGAEITEAHRDNVAKQVACMIADILQERDGVQAQWEDAVKVRHVPADNPFRERIAFLTHHMDRFIGEATSVASCEWRDPERFCHVLPVTEEFARDFRRRVMEETREVVKLRADRKSRRPHGAKP